MLPGNLGLTLQTSSGAVVSVAVVVAPKPQSIAAATARAPEKGLNTYYTFRANQSTSSQGSSTFTAALTFNIPAASESPFFNNTHVYYVSWPSYSVVLQVKNVSASELKWAVLMTVPARGTHKAGT